MLQGLELVQTTWPSLGVGGVLCGLMLYFYQHNVKDTKQRFAQYYKDHNLLLQEVLKALNNNTRVLTILTTRSHVRSCPLEDSEALKDLTSNPRKE